VPVNVGRGGAGGAGAGGGGGGGGGGPPRDKHLPTAKKRLPCQGG